MSGDSNATWIDAVKSRKRPARRLVLTEGDVGAQRTTKIGGAPWWPRDEPRNPAIGWYPPGTIGMEDLMHPKASDLGFIPADGRPNDGMGVVTRAAIKAYGVALDDIDEIPVPDDLPETIDLPDDFFGGTDLDPERPEGFAFVARC